MEDNPILYLNIFTLFSKEYIIIIGEGEVMKKTLIIIVCLVIGIFVLGIIIFSVIFATSKKLVCKSNEGNITIMYTDKTITGYTAKGMTYDLDTQKSYAKQIGIEAYLEEFSTWFSTNTTGSCTR